jgi:class 3 adenylate cyclase/tetratricopeptide (TPR) repeat protein
VSTCLSCGRENTDDALFCSACGSLIGATSQSTEARKTVTVVFADVTGSTALGESLDPESLRRVLTKYFDSMRDVIERHGGVVEKFIGDAVMAVFGIPQLHEDDALRAVKAAAAMREQLATLNHELTRDHGVRIETRTGVNTGEVVAGGPGAGQRLITGDAVNVAARLEQVAAPGEIVLGAKTHRLVRDVVRVEALEPLDLKGKSAKVAAFRLLEVLPDAAAIARRLDSPFVGREPELKLLRDQLAGCVAERACGLVTVLGAPGIGKSRLIGELIAGRGEAGFVVGHCLPYGDGITYWPLVEIVKQIAGGDARSVATLVPEDGELVAQGIAAVVGQSEGAASPEETFWAVRKLLEALARDRPLIVVLEDLEWAEPTFLDLVEYVLGFSSAPIFLVAVARPDLLERRPSWTAPRPNSTLLLLKPLPERESESLFDHLLESADVQPELRVRILEAAEGNPLFVEQMLAMSAESDLTESQIPPTIQALLAARIDRLEPDERAVAERGSVEGRLFHRGGVVELAPPQVRAGVSAHLLSLVRKDLIQPHQAEFVGEDAFWFRHNLIGDAAYAGIPKGLRSELHERFANWLEQTAGDRSREYEEILGYHFEQAYRYRRELGPLDGRARELGRRAGELLGGAGERAASRLDVTAAINLLDRALAVLPDGHEGQNALQLALCDALAEAGDLERATRMLTRMAAEDAASNDTTIAWRARIQLALMQQRTNTLSSNDALRLVEEALAALTPIGDDAGLAIAWQLAGQAQNLLGDMDEVRAAMQCALGHARRAGNVRLETESIFWIGLSAFLSDRSVSQSMSICSELVDAAQTPLQHTHARFGLAAVRGVAGELKGARLELEEARRTYGELGLEYLRASTVSACAEVELHGGDPVLAEELLREATTVLEAAGEKGVRSTILASLGEALYQQGRYEEADQVVAESEAISSPEDAVDLLMLATLKARLSARRGDYAHAEHAAREALAKAADSKLRFALEDALMGLAEILLLAGRGAEARRPTQEALELYESRGHRPSAERARRLLAGLPSP